MDNIYMQTKGFSTFIDEGTALPQTLSQPRIFKKARFSLLVIAITFVKPLLKLFYQH